MRVVMRPPAILAKVLGALGVAPAETDSEGFYVAEVGKLYYVRDEAGRASYVVFGADGHTRIIAEKRAEVWARLLDVGATDEEADRLSVI